MLQQTQVATVIPYFERWMTRFPDVDSLARASEDEVLAAWQGLGYYRRARMLLAGAKYASERGIPRTARQLSEVPSIGKYTAGAIASIAFSEPAPLVDGNVERVFARLTACDLAEAALHKAAWTWADRSVHPSRPGDWNQALMELGATICKPAEPQCDRCPAAHLCEARLAGCQTQLPIAGAKRQAVALTHFIRVPIWNDTYGIRQVPTGEWWAGMWGFPRTESFAELETLLPDVWAEDVGRFRHTVTHHRIEVKVSLARLEKPHPGLTWVRQEDLPGYALPSPQKKALIMVERYLGRPDKGERGTGCKPSLTSR